MPTHNPTTPSNNPVTPNNQDIISEDSEHKELQLQTQENEKLTAELVIANKELEFQNEEKEDRAAELAVANAELMFQNKQKEKRAAELVIANKELAFQNEEKENRAAELAIANKELIFQNELKEKRAAELVIANKELAFQNTEKENRAAELVIANKELVFQNRNKEKLAAELILANKELAFQNTEKEKRAAELAIANKELIFQNEEKEKRAAELTEAKQRIADLNISLEEKIVERTAQLQAANKELESFSYSVSHDLRAPLRAINGFTEILLEDYAHKLDADGKEAMDEIISNSKRMGELIDNLLEFSRIGKLDVSLVNVNMRELVDAIIAELKRAEPNRTINIIINELPNAKGDRNMLKQVFLNLIGNAFKYSSKKDAATIEIGGAEEQGSYVYYVTDNGAGFDMQYYQKLFGVFQRLHSNNEFEGTGVGLALVQRIVLKHGGKVWATGQVNEGACFYVALPNK